MKTIYLREKRSGNFELSNRKDHTHKFTTKRAAKEFFDHINQNTSRQIVKATYSQSQTYFNQLQQDSGYSLTQLSRLIAFAHGDNYVQVESV